MTLAILLVCNISGQTFAQQNTKATVLITATILPSSLVTANSFVFNDHDSHRNHPLDGVATVTVSCTAGKPFIISLEPGSPLTMASIIMDNADGLSDDLFTDASHFDTQRGKNDMHNSSVTTRCAGLSNPHFFTVFVRIPAVQAHRVDLYDDTITLTITY